MSNLIYQARVLLALVIITSAAPLLAQPRSAAVDYRQREVSASPLIRRQLTQLRQRKVSLRWTFDPVYTLAMDRDLRSITGAVVPTNFGQHVRTQNALAAKLMKQLVRMPQATSACNAGTVRFDWRKYDGVTPVRDQGMCGSCWLFGAHGAFEGNWFISNHASSDTSEQNTLDCAKASPCRGGWPSEALDYLRLAGSASETRYPYRATEGQCSQIAQPFKLYTWGYVSADDSVPGVEKLKEALCFHGPLAVALIATPALQSYGSEQVFNEHEDGDVNHVVTLIGWDEDKHAWLIKNSWGVGWGATGGYGTERGYAWIDYGSNKVGYGAVWAQVQVADNTEHGFKTDVWRIKDPIVTAPVTAYDGQHAPAMMFQAGDEVDLTAGGCVQRGGNGRSWKRYVNPSGPYSDRLYFGQIAIPGVTAGLVPIRSLGCRYDAAHPDVCTIHFATKVPDNIPEPQRYLRLGYTDNDYGDNGYWGHDDGTEDQCRGVGNAYLVLTITHHPSVPCIPDCVDLQCGPSRNNCGICPGTCAGGQRCMSGRCLDSPDCAPPQKLCQCADPPTCMTASACASACSDGTACPARTVPCRCTGECMTPVACARLCQSHANPK